MNHPKLYLDHFYRVVSEKAFEEAKEFLSVFPDSEHRKSDTNTGTWEGVYLMAADGTYLEIIKEDAYWKDAFVSMCTSQFGDELDLHASLCASFKDEFLLSKVNRPNGDPWIHTTMLERPDHQLFFYCLEYQGDERQKRKEKGKHPGNWLQSFDSLDCFVSSKQFSLIPSSVSWFASDCQVTGDSITLKIPRMSSDEFLMNLKKTASEKRGFKVIGKIDKKIKPLCLDFFTLRNDSGKFILEYRH